MKQYDSTAAFNAYNVGFLAGLRATNAETATLREVQTFSADEVEAWKEGVKDGQALRSSFGARELGDAGRKHAEVA